MRDRVPRDGLSKYGLFLAFHETIPRFHVQSRIVRATGAAAWKPLTAGLSEIYATIATPIPAAGTRPAPTACCALQHEFSSLLKIKRIKCLTGCGLRKYKLTWVPRDLEGSSRLLSKVADPGQPVPAARLGSEGPEGNLPATGSQVTLRAGREPGKISDGRSARPQG